MLKWQIIFYSIHIKSNSIGNVLYNFMLIQVHFVILYNACQHANTHNIVTTLLLVHLMCTVL